MKNRYSFSEDGKTCSIYFINGEHFVIDACDFNLVSQFTWWLGKRGYPVAKTSRKSKEGHKSITVHSLLLRPVPGFDVDHISRDKMDNRRVNLRRCTHQQNMFNQRMKKTNTSGYSGVSRIKSCGKYEAYIHRDGKKHYLGLYETAQEAAKARDAAAKIMFGEFVRLNCREVVA